jgi:hypothetical protein
MTRLLNGDVDLASDFWLPTVVLAFGFGRLRLTSPPQRGFRRNSRAENLRHAVRKRERKLAVVYMPLSPGRANPQARSPIRTR